MNKKPIANRDNTMPRKKDDALLKAAFEELFPYLMPVSFVKKIRAALRMEK